VERELKKDEAACNKGNGAKQQKLVKAEERDLAQLEAKVDASAQQGTTSPACAAQIDGEIEAIVRAVTQADETAPCPFSIVDAIINTFDAQSCSRVLSDPPGLTCSLPFNCSATFGLHGTIRLVSPDPGAQFSGRDCDTNGVIDLSRARRPRCNLECTCQNPPTTTTTTSTTTTTIFDECASVGASCAALRPCCPFLNCENNRCCETNGGICHSDPDCCSGLHCGAPAFPDPTRFCEPASASTTTTTLPCPCEMTGDPITVTNPPVPPTPAAPNRVDYLLVGGPVPSCIAHSGLSCLISYHVIDVGTGTDLANPAWSTPAGQIDWTEGASVGPHGEGAVGLVFYNYFGGSPDGETKRIYLVTDIKCPPPIRPDDPHYCE
jgi:hypothetical protein